MEMKQNFNKIEQVKIEDNQNVNQQNITQTPIVGKQWMVSEQVNSFHQSRVYRPIPIRPKLQNKQEHILVGKVSEQKLVGQVIEQLINGSNTSIINLKSPTINNFSKGSDNSLPLTQNLAQNSHFYLINNDFENNSIMASNPCNRVSNTVFSLQLEPTNANAFNNGNNCTIIKQSLDKNPQANISSSAFVNRNTLLSDSVNSELFLNNINSQIKRNGKQTNFESTQKVETKIIDNNINNGLNQMNGLMNKVFRGFLLFANEAKSRILYRYKIFTSLPPEQQMTMDFKWNNLTTEMKEFYIRRAEKQRNEEMESFYPKTNSGSVLPNRSVGVQNCQALGLNTANETQNKHVNDFVHNFISRKRQKLENSYSPKTQTTEHLNTEDLNKRSENSENPDIIIEYESIGHKNMVNIINKRKSLFSNVEELARPHISQFQEQNIKHFNTNYSVLTTITSVKENGQNY